MNIKEIINFIKEMDFFESLDSKELTLLAEKLIVQNYNAGVFVLDDLLKTERSTGSSSVVCFCKNSFTLS